MVDQAAQLGDGLKLRLRVCGQGRVEGGAIADGKPGRAQAQEAIVDVVVVAGDLARAGQHPVLAVEALAKAGDILVAPRSADALSTARQVIAAMNGLEAQWLHEDLSFDLVAEWDKVAVKLIL